MLDEERAKKYGVFFNFPKREAIKFDAVEATAKISQQQATAAMVRNLSENPKMYGFLRNREYKREAIPAWVARPSQAEIEEIEDTLARGGNLSRARRPRTRRAVRPRKR